MVHPVASPAMMHFSTAFSLSTGSAAGHCEAHRAGIVIRLGSKFIFAAAKYLGFGI